MNDQRLNALTLSAEEMRGLCHVKKPWQRPWYLPPTPALEPPDVHYATLTCFVPIRLCQNLRCSTYIQFPNGLVFRLLSMTINVRNPIVQCELDTWDGCGEHDPVEVLT